MKDFMDLCLRRQSCRSFADKPVEDEKLLYCVKAARLAPSACNSQPWSFVVVKNPEIVPEVAKCSHQLGVNEHTNSAKAFFVILEEKAKLMPKLRCFLDSQYFAKSDLGGAMLTLCYAAEQQDLGTCILGLYDRDRLRELLDIPAEKTVGGLVAVGYPASNNVRNKVRKPTEELIRFI